jgi:adenylate kinase family enzyme
MREIKIASVSGVSFTGKSTLATGIVERLEVAGVQADVVRKDDAMRALGRQRYGDDDQTGGYSIRGALKHRGVIPSSELHGWMNERVQASRALGHTVLLEGGTRTRTAQAQTLDGVELGPGEFHIFMLQLPFHRVLQRAYQRMREDDRYDDGLLVAGVKLAGQYWGARSSDAPQPTDPDVTVLNARLPSAQLAEITAARILGIHPTPHP